MPDLAVRSLGGAAVWTNDDLFAEVENLITPAPAEYRPSTFGHRGQIYDGWETRRRRPAAGSGPGAPTGVDRAIVRLGVPGIIHGVVVDTSWFVGNYPPTVSVEAATVEGHPSADEVAQTAQWHTIVERSEVGGDRANPFAVESKDLFTHVRLSIYPDGGVARLRVHGRGVPDPALLGHGSFDLAALENGGMITACSNMFYGSPNNLLMPGRARSMGEGWRPPGAVTTATTGFRSGWPTRASPASSNSTPATSSATRPAPPACRGATATASGSTCSDTPSCSPTRVTASSSTAWAR